MENKFKLPFITHKDSSLEKHSDLVQIIIIISSGILSSTAIATALKAWIDNRKTSLTIQIDGDTKKLEYQGHHLSQDAAAIQHIVEKMSEESNVVQSVNTVTIELSDSELKEEYVLEARDIQVQTESTESEHNKQAIAVQQPFILKRIVPGWHHKKSASQ